MWRRVKRTSTPPTAPPGSGGLDEPLQLLYDDTTATQPCLADQIREGYGSDLVLPDSCLYGNFVCSLDGVVALGPEYPSSGSAISGREPADRFVMALLRAAADAVLIGAGTLRATPAHEWTAEHVWPAAAEVYAQMRRERRQPGRPLLVVVSGSGHVPSTHPALQHSTLLVTSARGTQAAASLPATVRQVVLADTEPLPMVKLIEIVRSHGCGRILTEGGPNLLGQLLDTDLLDDLFLTLAPHVAGRDTTPRPGLVSHQEFLPHQLLSATLTSVRRHGSFLFLRYKFSHRR